MDYYIDFSQSNSFIFERFDEKLEAEYILRARSIFDEFVSPDTGIFLMCTFGELLNGINRLWSLAQEMNEKARNIHERLIQLPLLFAISLLRVIEEEYEQEDLEKSLADPTLTEALLTLLNDLNAKILYFQQSKVQMIVYNTLILYTQHCVKLVSTTNVIKRMKWNELRVEGCRISCPFRLNDLKYIRQALLHFRLNILPHFSKRSVRYNLTFRNKVPEIMEPSRELQVEVAEFLNIFSSLLGTFAILLYILTAVISGETGSTGSAPEGPNYFND